MAKPAGAHSARAQEKDKGTKLLVAALVLVVLALAVCLAFIFANMHKQDAQQPAADAGTTAGQPLQLESGQGAYVKPETPVDRSKNVTLPGWGGFTIPANTTDITQGFEFHNPAENLWYEDVVSVGGTELEHLVADSGTAVELGHYLKLAGIDSDVAEVVSYDADCFAVATDDAGAYTLEATSPFEETKTVTVRTSAGEDVELSISCEQEFYYMTFGLYLAEGDELLYQSGLVEPGNYIQQMEMSRALEPGTYDAYVVCQPYRSDGVTKTNQGVVRITLTAA